MNTIRIIVMIASAGLCLGGCANEKRADSRPGATQTKPEASANRGSTESPAKSGDAANGTASVHSGQQSNSPTAGATTTQPAHTTTTPAPAKEPAAIVPDYVVVLERFASDKPYAIDVKSDDPLRLTIRTNNIKRLQIRRHGSGLSETKSVAIQIDLQGIEWTPKLDAVELARSANGAWLPVERK